MRPLWPEYLLIDFPSATSVMMTTLSLPPVINFELSLVIAKPQTS